MPSPSPHRRKRPRVPDPPESLIKLLQSDPNVLAYMQSLQANLDEDVRIWKERALGYQKQLEQQPKKRETIIPVVAKKKKSMCREELLPLNVETMERSKSTAAPDAALVAP